MANELWSVWKHVEGSKVSWKVQYPRGIMTFRTKKAATANAEANRQFAAGAE